MRRYFRPTLFAVFSLVLLLSAACQPAATRAAPTSLPATPVPPTSAPVTPPPATAIGSGSVVLRLATTASTAGTSLLDAILPAFSAKYGAQVSVLAAANTGQALALGVAGDADVVLVHDRAQEDNFVIAGDGANRLDVMTSDFVIVGPKSDPASARNLPQGADAFALIAERGAPFVSRGDHSDANNRELSLWAEDGITATANETWYHATGQGMIQTLAFANQNQAYAFTDRPTWLAQQANLPNLVLLAGGATVVDDKDPEMLNPYGVIPVNNARHPKVNFDLATKFANWITSVDEQQIISDFGRDRYGQPLFVASSAAWKAAHP